MHSSQWHWMQRFASAIASSGVYFDPCFGIRFKATASERSVYSRLSEAPSFPRLFRGSRFCARRSTVRAAFFAPYAAAITPPSRAVTRCSSSQSIRSGRKAASGNSLDDTSDDEHRISNSVRFSSKNEGVISQLKTKLISFPFRRFSSRANDSASRKGVSQ